MGVGRGLERRPEWEDGLDERTSGKDLQDNDDDPNNDGVCHVRYGRPGPVERSENSREC